MKLRTVGVWLGSYAIASVVTKALGVPRASRPLYSAIGASAVVVAGRKRGADVGDVGCCGCEGAGAAGASATLGSPWFTPGRYPSPYIIGTNVAVG